MPFNRIDPAAIELPPTEAIDMTSLVTGLLADQARAGSVEVSTGVHPA